MPLNAERKGFYGTKAADSISTAPRLALCQKNISDNGSGATTLWPLFRHGKAGSFWRRAMPDPAGRHLPSLPQSLVLSFVGLIAFFLLLVFCFCFYWLGLTIKFDSFGQGEVLSCVVLFVAFRHSHSVPFCRPISQPFEPLSAASLFSRTIASKQIP